MNREEFDVEVDGGGAIRADRFVASLGMFTRSQMARRSVRVMDGEGGEIKPSKRLTPGARIVVEWDDPPDSRVAPEPLDLDVVYEDDDCVVVNKAQGTVVHPAHGHLHGTLVQGLLYRYAEWEASFGGDRIRPGIVHRLDKDTSGLIIAAKNPEAHEFLSAQFRERTAKKSYLALTKGGPSSDGGEVDAPIGRDPRDRKKFAADVSNGKAALSRYEVLGRSGDYSLVSVGIMTGRTHQIRVHMKSIGAPVLGDPIYARRDPRFPDATLMLHSWRLSIALPSGSTGEFEAPVPERFANILGLLEIPLPRIPER